MPEISCPLPKHAYDQILLAHGGGGRLTRQLIRDLFLPAFDNPALATEHDGAIVEWNGGRLALTTDSYVVRPLIFPGGDIGSLAVNGTVNDLAMCGAHPRWISAGFIIEEGLRLSTLGTIVASMRTAARAAGVELVTGDTKVVDKGKGDGLYINTTGVGTFDHTQLIAPQQVRPGDAVLLSGDIGRHGVAILACREGIEFETTIQSDCAPLNGTVAALLNGGIRVHCLRDLTRGGLATALNEIASAAAVQIHIIESAVPVSPPVQGACELLGLDALYVANEGRFIAFIPPEETGRALEILRSLATDTVPERIGTVAAGPEPLVTLRSPIGSRRILDLLTGEQLPRIC